MKKEGAHRPGAATVEFQKNLIRDWGLFLVVEDFSD